MINDKRVVAIIPARGGSKSIPHKNIKPLAGKPLIAWSIEIAKRIPEIDRVIVSTDDSKIADIAKKYGAEVNIRPKELSGDQSLIIDTLRDIIPKIKERGETADYMVLLEPTSPLRNQEDIQKTIELLSNGDFDSTATFVEAELNPHRAWKITDKKPSVFIDGAIPWLPRQKLPNAYQLNGAVYAFCIEKLPTSGVSVLFGNIGAVIMPKERSIDIDNKIQWKLTELLLEERDINE